MSACAFLFYFYNKKSINITIMFVFLRVLDQFDSLPGHLTEDLHLFSLNDLTAVRNGDLAPRMKELLKLGTMHVAGCVVR